MDALILCYCMQRVAAIYVAASGLFLWQQGYSCSYAVSDSLHSIKKPYNFWLKFTVE
jgi:hypothetical protein